MAAAASSAIQLFRFQPFASESSVGSVPELSRFFGVIIRMYWETGAPHHVPHFHAYYQDAVAVYRIDPVELIAGGLPRRQQRMVEAWAELHEAELMADWQRLQAGQPSVPIAPLG